jgi:hypothetical protein
MNFHYPLAGWSTHAERDPNRACADPLGVPVLREKEPGGCSEGIIVARTQDKTEVWQVSEIRTAMAVAAGIEFPGNVAVPESGELR